MRKCGDLKNFFKPFFLGGGGGVWGDGGGSTSLFFVGNSALSYLGNATAAEKVVLPIVFPDSGMAASVWDFWLAHICWCMWFPARGCTDTVKSFHWEGLTGRKLYCHIRELNPVCQYSVAFQYDTIWTERVCFVFLYGQNLRHSAHTTQQLGAPPQHVWSSVFCHCHLLHGGLRGYFSWHLAWPALHAPDDLHCFRLHS